MYRPHDNIGALVTLKSSGSVEKTVVGSIMEALSADSENEADWARLREIFRSPSLQMVTFTITEKGYLLRYRRFVQVFLHFSGINSFFN